MKQYKIGMSCPKHHCCDIVNARDSETGICTQKHLYEITKDRKKYDLVFYTTTPENYYV